MSPETISLRQGASEVPLPAAAPCPTRLDQDQAPLRVLVDGMAFESAQWGIQRYFRELLPRLRP